MKKLIAVFVLAFAAGALADMSFTYSSANARVAKMEFYPRTGGAVTAVVCGATTATAGAPELPCKSTELGAADPIAVSVTALATGQALTFWKTANGL